MKNLKYLTLAGLVVSGQANGDQTLGNFPSLVYPSTMHWVERDANKEIAQDERELAGYVLSELDVGGLEYDCESEENYKRCVVNVSVDELVYTIRVLDVNQGSNDNNSKNDYMAIVLRDEGGVEDLLGIDDRLDGVVDVGVKKDYVDAVNVILEKYNSYSQEEI